MVFNKTETKIFFTIWIIYIFFMSSYSGSWTSDPVIAESLSLVENHTFNIDGYLPEECKQYGCDTAFFRGHFYSGFAPGGTFMMLPLLFIAKPLFMSLPDYFMGYSYTRLSLILATMLGIIFIVSLLSALLSVYVYRFAGYLTASKRIKLLTVFTFAFGTLIFVYSTEYNTRVIGASLNFIAFFILFRCKHDNNIKNSSLFLAGLLCGIAVFTEYTQVLIVFFVFMYLLTFLRDRRIFYFIFGGFLIFLAFISYHYFVFGGLFSTAYDYRADKIAVQDVNYGFYSAYFPTGEALWGLSLSPEKGLLLYVPISILSLIGAFLALKRGREYRYFAEVLIIIGICVVLFLYNSSLGPGNWRANCGFGPRYLISIMPFLILPAIFAFGKINFKITLLFSGASVFVNLLPALYGTTVLWKSFDKMGCNSDNAIFKEYIPLLFDRGVTNFTLNLIKYRIYDLPVYVINIIAISLLALLGFLIWLIWRRE